MNGSSDSSVETSWEGLEITIEEQAIELKAKVKTLSDQIESYSTDMRSKMEQMRANDTAEALMNLTSMMDAVVKRLTAIEGRLPEAEPEAPTIRK